MWGWLSVGSMGQRTINDTWNSAKTIARVILDPFSPRYFWILFICAEQANSEKSCSGGLGRQGFLGVPLVLMLAAVWQVGNLVDLASVVLFLNSIAVRAVYVYALREVPVHDNG